MDDVLYELDTEAAFDAELGTRILAELAARRVVIWRSGSGAILGLVLDPADGLARVRINLHDPLDFDGHVLLFDSLDATSCGLWTSDGYTSSPPVLVTSHPAGTDFGEAIAVLRPRLKVLLAAAHETAPGWRDIVRPGHPTQPCPVAQCGRRIPTEDR